MIPKMKKRKNTIKTSSLAMENFSECRREAEKVLEYSLHLGTAKEKAFPISKKTSLPTLNLYQTKFGKIVILLLTEGILIFSVIKPAPRKIYPCSGTIRLFGNTF